MAVELECKVAVASHHGLAEKLRAAGAEYLGRVLEVNRLFDNAEQALLHRGCGLRVRSVRILDGHANGAAATLTFKGPVQTSTFKQREEVELPIGDADAMALLLTELGYVAWLTFEKRRETWRYCPGDPNTSCTVVLDELPELGCFVEIEGPTQACIERVAALLELDAGGSITRSYAALIAERQVTAHAGPMTLRFAAKG